VDGLVSEREQIEAIRNWWADNGRYVIAGVLLGIALLVGWNYWKKQKAQTEAQASALYESLAADVADVEVKDAEAAAADLYADYESTIYARQARLAMAKLYMSAGRDQDAAGELTALINGDEGDELQMIGRLRLARILLYQEKPQEAVDLLQGFDDTAFAARYSEALGDAYVALGRFEDARDAYTAALADNPQAPTVDAALIRMKINDLPPPSAGEAEGSPETAGAEFATPADQVRAGEGESPPTAEDSPPEGDR
jgi:predicted negative regulator of RcsB-dependent stress response